MSRSRLGLFWRNLQRRKFVDLANVEQTNLRRCLSTLDLTFLGIGSTLGAGIYVVAGQVARETAGPGVTLSFLIAAVASILAGLCYAEFGARVPKTGSAYVYSYVTVGELWAFIIGWNLILEYVIGTASVARAWSSYFDSLIDFKMKHYFTQHTPMDVSFLSSYPDFFAFALSLALAVVLAVGVKESSTFNNVFTVINLFVVVYVIIVGLFKADFYNWSIPDWKVPESAKGGSGGFVPFGFSGVIAGAATCFYAFVGFDIIATTGEECRNPQRAIPVSIIVALLVCFLAYFGVSGTITLMVPYYTIDEDAPLPDAFKRVGYPVARYVITVGAVCGLTASLLGAMFPLPRIIYAMADDGLIYRFLSRINERFRTPFLATIISGAFAGFMAMIFDLDELVDMMSIGTLMAYTLVAACVLLLRYKGDDEENENPSSGEYVVSDSLWQRLFFPLPAASPESYSVVSWTTAILSFFMVLLSATFRLNGSNTTSYVIASCMGAAILVGVVIILRQPQSTTRLSFKVPLLPWLPLISCFINLYLMMNLSAETWIRFGVWMALGFFIYFSYGYFHSTGAERSFQPLVAEVSTASVNGKVPSAPLEMSNVVGDPKGRADSLPLGLLDDTDEEDEIDPLDTIPLLNERDQ